MLRRVRRVNGKTQSLDWPPVTTSAGGLSFASYCGGFRFLAKYAR